MDLAEIDKNIGLLPDESVAYIQALYDTMVADGVPTEMTLIEIKEVIGQELLRVHGSAQQEYIEEENERQGTLWFLYSPLVQMTLPHKDPKTNVYSRTNGLSELSWVTKNGVPFGTHARHILVHATTVSKKGKTDEVYFGESMGEFVRRIGLNRSGKLYANVQTQLDRMRASMLTLETKQEILGHKKVLEFKNIRIFSEGSLWWDDDYKKGGASLILAPEFMENLETTAVPFEQETLLRFANSCIKMDTYMLLTYRAKNGSNRSIIPWAGLFHQLGGNYKRLSDFKRDFKKAVNEVAPYIDGYRFLEFDSGVRILKSS